MTTRAYVRGAAVAAATSLLLVAGSWAQAPEPPQLPSVTLPAALARVLTDYETAWQNKDAAGLAALFAEDGFVLSSGVPPVRVSRTSESSHSRYEGVRTDAG
jgi:hypothetical protein